MLSRRDFLKLGGATAVAATASGCSVIGREAARRQLPESLPAPVVHAPDRVRRLLDRAGYGPRPGDVERVQQMGYEAYLEQQLHPETIEDTAVSLMDRQLTVYHMDVSQLVEQEQRDAAFELLASTLMRAVYSQRQLYEAMVAFWSDHFNVYLRKNQFTPLLKVVDDRDAIRPHALGTFRDLLSASAYSPAMLVYLDNVRNEKRHPNENYARELLELHTLGVDGGYNQQDVEEVARALTGLTVARRGRRKGQVVFRPALHDDGEKQVLGHTLPAGQGERDIAQVLDILAAHPATADFIAAKLVRRFVADEPPAALVNRVAQTFRDSGGDIRAMLRVIFLSDEFADAPPKLKRPFPFLVSALRALHADVRPTRDLGHWLERLGQLPFHWPAPDGYPDVSSAWAANLLPRWNVALKLAHDEIPGVTPRLAQIGERADVQTSAEAVALFAGLVNGRLPNDEIRQQLLTYVGNNPLDDHETRLRLRDAVALLLAGPQFQWT